MKIGPNENQAAIETPRPPEICAFKDDLGSTSPPGFRPVDRRYPMNRTCAELEHSSKPYRVGRQKIVTLDQLPGILWPEYNNTAGSCYGKAAAGGAMIRASWLGAVIKVPSGPLQN